uniref:Iodothyronine deiodinase n=1 Tax=Paramoeba aestuarina TaxID=180227 RepID=A0A7S4NQC0_9EUKA|mmetsp:Transcript_23213/g.36180  ORF Transcript_23213/g.36180 Transcript_23213/m.36180 type:complete len:136 (+) Transcript_23213:117-524(+)
MKEVEGNKGVGGIDFVTIYILEAHPLDCWPLFKEIDYNQPTTLEERLKVVEGYVDGTGIKGDVVVDLMTNEVEKKFAAWPERLYVLLNGVIIYKGGKGPEGYVLSELVSVLDQYFPPSPSSSSPSAPSSPCSTGS